MHNGEGKERGEGEEVNLWPGTTKFRR